MFLLLQHVQQKVETHPVQLLAAAAMVEATEEDNGKHEQHMAVLKDDKIALATENLITCTARRSGSSYSWLTCGSRHRCNRGCSGHCSSSEPSRGTYVFIQQGHSWEAAAKQHPSKEPSIQSTGRASVSRSLPSGQA